MKAIFLAATILFSITACVQSDPYSDAPGAKPKNTAISNEFTVMGDRSVVEAGLKEMGVKAQIESFNTKLNLHHVTYQGDKPYGAIAEKLAPKVERIEQDSRVTINAIERKVEWSEDKYFFYQWASNNIGQSAPWGLPGEYDADMKLLEALTKYRSNLQEDTIVAVIDTGVNYKHDDLNANMWVNEPESTKAQGVGGVDDDGNGYTDDVHGFDFTSAGRVAPHYGKKGDPDPMDEQGHGSHCAGNIAAVENNGRGIAGANPKAKIMALRALGNAGGQLSDIHKAITYAIENGANIISASYGGGADDEITKALIEQAGEAGILFVAAAGNDGQSMEIKANRKYPASYQLPSLLTVGASDNMDNPATFSNYGHNYVDVFAPGVGIISLYMDQSYVIMDGTSMATPLVAGIASLVMSAYPELKKDPVRVKEIIMATVDRKPSMYGKVKSNGRVNALAALDKAQSAVTVPPIEWAEMPYPIVEKGYNQELVDIRHTIEKKGAKAIRIHFDFLEIDRSFDSVYIYDENFDLISEIQNGSSRDLWSPVVVGEKAIIRFVNAKVEKQEGQTEITMPSSKQAECLNTGGKIIGPAPKADPTQPVTDFICLQEKIDYRYEDLQKDVNGTDVFFSWQSEGFSIDKIEYTETSI